MRKFYQLMFVLMAFSINASAQFANDLRIEKVIMGDLRNDYVYTMIPASQAAEIIAGVVVSNVGLADQTNLSYDWEVQLDGNSVANGTESGLTLLASGGVDTIWISTGYTPHAEGEIEVLATVSSDETDEVPSDNSLSGELEITHDIWGHDYVDEQYEEIGFQSTEPDGAQGFEMGAKYHCKIDGDFIYGVQFALGSSTTGTTVILKIYENSTATLVSETYYDFLPSDLSSGNPNFIIGLLEDPVELLAGNEYVATVEIFSGQDGFIMGQNIDDGDGGQTLYLGVDDMWYEWTGQTTSIRLHFDYYGGEWDNVDENEHVSGVYLYPNPAADNLTIGFVSKDGKDLHVNVLAIDGELIASELVSPSPGQNAVVRFDMENLAAGVYLVQIQGETSNLTHRVIVE